MRLRFAGAILLAVAAYYVYLPLPGGVSEPWKLMLLDALIRAFICSHILWSKMSCHVGNIFYQDKYFLMTIIDTFICSHILCDGVLGGVPSRIFQATGGRWPKRGVLYFHGGGWALGTARMRSYDFLCRKMAEELDAVVISVDYRLAPEAMFPDQYHDALTASRAFLSKEVAKRYSLDRKRLCVSGDSSGGNLAAAVAQELGSDVTLTAHFKVQALIYPVLQALDFHTPSYQQNKAVPILYRPVMARYWLLYLGADPSLQLALLANNHSALDQPAISPAARSHLDWTVLLPAERKKEFRPLVVETGTPGLLGQVPALLDARAVPLLAKRDVLAKTPDAYVLTCEFDVLRDDGLMYAERLRRAGVRVTSDHYEDGFHGCISFAHLPVMSAVGRRAVDNYIRWLDHNL
uniref:Neutral cholesterol ester hydrolase 1 n=1 Tax=Hippocampus comes TaxID=109280 RepID=A0A3Q2YTA4_HIPCM